MLSRIRLAHWHEAHALPGLLLGSRAVAYVVQRSHHVEAGIENVLCLGFRSIQLGDGLINERLCLSQHLERFCVLPDDEELERLFHEDIQLLDLRIGHLRWRSRPILLKEGGRLFCRQHRSALRQQRGLHGLHGTLDRLDVIRYRRGHHDPLRRLSKGRRRVADSEDRETHHPSHGRYYLRFDRRVQHGGKIAERKPHEYRTNAMADIFLSYADRDRKTIRPLVRAFEQEGWSVFWDREIPLGKTWRQVLDEELSAARCVVVVWTETSVGRRWVIEEAEEGQGRGILIPVFMDRVDPPRGFREVQGAQLLDWKGKSEHKEFQRLCGACRDVIGEPGQPPPETLESTKPERRSISRFKWMAAALALALAAGGSWLWYQTAKPQVGGEPPTAEEPVAPDDFLIAALQYKEACDRGSATDCNRLGDLYSSGRGVGKDLLRAAALYQRACDGDFVTACVSLGLFYQEGRAVAKDEERAARLYQQACDEGLGTGCERLELLKKVHLERAKEPTSTTSEARAADRSGTASESLAARPAQLRITVLPWGDVWINGKQAERAPRDLSLKPGRYTISVGQGTPATTRVVRLKPGEQRTEHFDLSE